MSYLVFTHSYSLDESWNTLKFQAKKVMEYGKNVHGRIAYSKPVYLNQNYNMKQAEPKLIKLVKDFMGKNKLRMFSIIKNEQDDIHSDIMRNYYQHKENRTKEADSQGLIRGLHTVTTNWPIRYDTNNNHGKRISNLYVTFDDEKVYSVKGLFAPEDNPSSETSKRMEIPGAKEVIMQCKYKD